MGQIPLLRWRKRKNSAGMQIHPRIGEWIAQLLHPIEQRQRLVGAARVGHPGDVAADAGEPFGQKMNLDPRRAQIALQLDKIDRAIGQRNIVRPVDGRPPLLPVQASTLIGRVSLDRDGPCLAGARPP